ncbi:SIR2 family NAD-dependent protein deacylase [Thauera linaloolentis]|uniref:protein acetyllysine N-acetyltransferase n=1 Tax=Thauera linaloolentis (strain DSM 12138 / JCM 21573 / CCUG 41526 / CIP 105981 / IAM 15112 / NBRC 102519 / 47Lol) TaxID=1123367 RepID=N6YSC9_THAL4|nr:Sir2 family NAD-dependent protein deacetylase [Thauera linaloolentis]ENO85277.1 Sir2 family transcriptional regulator [Thauera linaloolentis 47Lol = DSM 12138]MCM8564956.1 NAD-dependent deacetylase [Thauera linaloolentis]
MHDLNTAFARCARLIAQADGLLVTAGAGLGVDSGLPDFRGSEGMWQAYPALGKAGIHFREIANPAAFLARPRLAWGFYGHRLRLYRETCPGAAFGMLRNIARHVPQGAFVFTSNVDGQFQKAGFDERRIVECHGSIHHLQCIRPCTATIWSADGFEPDIDADACKLIGAPPRCPSCGALARPNILMFGDWDWIEARTQAQRARLDTWRRTVDRLLVIEIGAGTAVPSVRIFGESQGAPIIRINLREAQTTSDSGVALPLTATEAMLGITHALATGRQAP